MLSRLCTTRAMIHSRVPSNLSVAVSERGFSRGRWYKKNRPKKSRPKNAVPKYPKWRRVRSHPEDSDEETASDSDLDVIASAFEKKYLELERELEPVKDKAQSVMLTEEEMEAAAQPPADYFPDYRIPHRFVGFNPRRMDLEGFPRIRTDFDGNKSELAWLGTECQRCGLQIRRERRTNRETSLNVYANARIPDELLRHCPEEKLYPVLWRTRDPYVALDILGVADY